MGSCAPCLTIYIVDPVLLMLMELKDLCVDMKYIWGWKFCSGSQRNGSNTLIDFPVNPE